SEVPVWILGSSTYGAQLAAALGLPFAFASHFAPTYLHEALHLYKERFRPSRHLQAPYALACVNALAAGSDAEAQRLATSYYRLILGLVRNHRQPLAPPVDSMDGLWNDAERAAVQHMARYAFVGSAATVREGLSDFIAETGVQELMITSNAFDLDARIRSYELLMC
ncbi:MAG: MsnO8 family LLM class oxidoreductase, partial [Chitinophagaceae bacterium]